MDPIAGRRDSNASTTARFMTDGPSRLSNQGGCHTTGKRRRSRAIARLVFTMVLFAGFAFASAQAQPRHSPIPNSAQAIERGMVLAQAGSTGGSVVAPESIGKKGKSISSSPAAGPPVAAPANAEPKRRTVPRRSRQPKAQGGCGPCVRKLQDDIAGHVPSPLIRSLVAQAITAYENCKSAAEGACSGGDHIVEKLRGCSVVMFDAYRRCIQDALSR